MKYTPDYQIELSGGGKVPLLFNSWTFKTYSERRGIEFEDLLQQIQSGQIFRAKNLPDLLLASAQSFCKYNGEATEYTEIDAFQWIDQMGGLLIKEDSEFLQIFKLFVARLLNKSPKDFDIEKEEVEVDADKKKESLAGMTSM